MSKSVAIVQSNYLPWKGYFDILRAVDEFIVYDDVQYTKRDWRNRNRFKSPTGVRWLTIPVQVKGRYLQKINETTVSDPRWGERHWSTISTWYGRAPYFENYRATLEDAYLGMADTSLSAINRRFLMLLASFLRIPTRITSSEQYPGNGRKADRLVSICKAAGATHYLSGPAARAYLDEATFASEGIEVAWMTYEGYPQYPQLYPPFEHHVSALDLVFNTGPRAPDYLLGAK
jgi:hypothetical protein